MSFSNTKLLEIQYLCLIPSPKLLSYLKEFPALKCKNKFFKIHTVSKHT